MAWTKLNQQKNYFKFTEEGDTLEGHWTGCGDGRFGRIGTVNTEDGEYSFSINAALQDLENIEPGTLVRIVFTGWEKTKSGISFKQYDIFAEDGP